MAAKASRKKPKRKTAETTTTRSPKPGAPPAKRKPAKPGATPVPKPSARRSRASGESADERLQRCARIVKALRELYPDATCALHHRNAFELLIATILSAQSTDVGVNKVTPVLFARFPTPAALAAADPADVEHIIHATGFFRQKTRSIIGAAKAIVERFDGRVPDTMDGLTSLPGVARKTANVVLGTCFGKNEGVVVDTHVGRLSTRLRLTWNGRDEKDAPRIEPDLMRIVPREDWSFFGHAMIWHGRKVCAARNPKCAACALSDDCPSSTARAGDR